MTMLATTDFVLDNSILCGWFLHHQATPYGDAVSQRLKEADAHAPWLLPLEFTNVLRTVCRRGSLPINKAREIVDAVAGLPIHLDGNPPTAAMLLNLAMRFDLTSYDTSYLELALRLQIPIATRNIALSEAAWAAGVGVYEVE